MTAVIPTQATSNEATEWLYRGVTIALTPEQQYTVLANDEVTPIIVCDSRVDAEIWIDGFHQEMEEIPD